MIQYRLIPFDELTSASLAYWSSVCENDHRFDSPYFCPEFAKCVHSVRSDCSVIVAERNDEPLGILPIQTPSANHAFPIGGKMNDVHGLICHSPFEFDIQRMLQQTGLKTYSFHSSIASPAEMGPSQFESITSPVINLQRGFDSYLDWVCRSSKTIKRQPQKTRKMISEVGPLRFEWHNDSKEILERVIELKRQRYLSTKTFDLFSVHWAKSLVNRIFESQGEPFAGNLSVLWAGDQLVAGHFGLRSRHVLHYWFPVYDPKFRMYSPGIQLILEMARIAEENGIKKIDLGYGTQPFKFKLSNDQYETACGKFSSSRLSHSLSRRIHFTKKWLMATPIQPVAKNIVRTVNPSFGHWVFR